METIPANPEDNRDQIRKMLSWGELFERVKERYRWLMKTHPDFHPETDSPPIRIWGIPRGGTYVALLWKACYEKRMVLVSSPESADLLVDDIIDTGKTAEYYNSRYGKPVVALYSRKELDEKGWEWLVFPWEIDQGEIGPTENIRRVLQYIGEDPNREGLLETPERVVRSWDQLYGGYHQKAEDVLKVFEDDSSDEMVLLKDVEFYSTCEHHMLPFFGKAHIAYLPNGKVVGISKLARILEVYSRRLQIQERLCQQITGAIMDCLQPRGAACVLEAKHFCMTSRGVEKQESKMVTSSLVGAFKEDATTRSELFSLID